MTSGCTHFSPFAGYRSYCVFNGIQCALNIRLQAVVAGKCPAPEITRYAGIENIQCGSANVLAILQVFMIAKAVACPISPRAVGAYPLFNRANGFFPIGCTLNGDAFHKTSTRPADKSRFQIGNVLCEVPAQTIGTIMKCVNRQ